MSRKSQFDAITDLIHDMGHPVSADHAMNILFVYYIMFVIDSFDGSKPCQCNTACESHNDCCDDYMTVCSAPEDSCAGRCG